MAIPTENGDVLARNSGGVQVIGRPMARPAWYPVERVRPVRVEVWWRYDGEVAAAARLIGIYAPGQVVQAPLNPMVDRDLIFSTVTVSSDGLRSVRELADAHEIRMPYQRETTAPTVSQIGTSTNTQIQLAVDAYSSLVIMRRIKVADNVGMTTNLVVIETTINPADLMQRVIYLNRTAAPAAKTIYVTIAHSSGGDYGPESTPLACTYATSGGTGGTSGTGQTFPHREYTLAP